MNSYVTLSQTDVERIVLCKHIMGVIGRMKDSNTESGNNFHEVILVYENSKLLSFFSI
jgi:hypothetical protein